MTDGDLIREAERRRVANFVEAYAGRVRSGHAWRGRAHVDLDSAALLATMLNVVATAIRADLCDPEANWPLTDGDRGEIAASEVA